MSSADNITPIKPSFNIIFKKATSVSAVPFWVPKLDASTVNNMLPSLAPPPNNKFILRFSNAPNAQTGI